MDSYFKFLDLIGSWASGVGAFCFLVGVAVLGASQFMKMVVGRL